MRLAIAWLVLCACGEITGTPIDARITVTGVTVTPDTITMKRGFDAAPKQLTAMATLSDGTHVDVTSRSTWDSSSPSVATVDHGLMTPLTGGTMMITATYDGMSGTATVTIKSPELFVTDYFGTGSMAIGVYDPYADGDTPPIRRIVGATTTFQEPIAVAVYKDEIYVSDIQANAIDVFPVSATGDVAPTRRIVGATTALTSPLGISVVNDEIYVTSTSKVLVFPSTATGNIAPTRTIISAQLVGTIYGLAVANGELYIGNLPDHIAVFPLTSNGDSTATRLIKGAMTQLTSPYGLSVSNGELLVANGSNILVFPTSADGNVPPIRRIAGPDTGFGSVVGVVTLGDELYESDVGPKVHVYSRSATSDAAPTRTITGPSTLLVHTFTTTFY